ncbi:MAG: hypothetical protein K1X70_09495 [Leptospirales bacterium]|nr:hypothetical protein [Leptospirales bacterium]
MKFKILIATIQICAGFLLCFCQKQEAFIRINVDRAVLKTIPGNQLKDYPLRNLVDGNINTSWCQSLGPDLEPFDENNNGFAFQTAAGRLESPTDFFLYSGVQGANYKRYDRPRKIIIELSAEPIANQFDPEPVQRFSFDLEDTSNVQKLRIFPKPDLKFVAVRFVLHNKLAYPGSEHRNMCIAEITAYNPVQGHN